MEKNKIASTEERMTTRADAHELLPLLRSVREVWGYRTDRSIVASRPAVVRALAASYLRSYEKRTDRPAIFASDAGGSTAWMILISTLNQHQPTPKPESHMFEVNSRGEASEIVPTPEVGSAESQGRVCTRLDGNLDRVDAKVVTLAEEYL